MKRTASASSEEWEAGSDRVESDLYLRPADFRQCLEEDPLKDTLVEGTREQLRNHGESVYRDRFN